MRFGWSLPWILSLALARAATVASGSARADECPDSRAVLRLERRNPTPGLRILQEKSELAATMARGRELPTIRVDGVISQPWKSLIVGGTVVPVSSSGEFAVLLAIDLDEAVARVQLFKSATPKTLPDHEELIWLSFLSEAPTQSPEAWSRVRAQCRLGRRPFTISVFTGLQHLSFDETAIALFSQWVPTVALESELELSRGRSTLAGRARGPILAAGASLVSDEHRARAIEADLLYRHWFDGSKALRGSRSAIRAGAGLAYRTMLVTDGAYGYSGLLGPSFELSAFRDHFEASVGFSSYSAELLPQTYELRLRAGMLLGHAAMRSGPEFEWARLAFRTGPGASMSQSTWALSWRWTP